MFSTGGRGLRTTRGDPWAWGYGDRGHVDGSTMETADKLICPHCDVYLPETQCDCVDEKIDSPFAVLAKLKTEGD